MKKLLFINVLLIVFNVADSKSKSLTAKLTNADSVFLISHQSIPHSLISIVDSTGKEINLPLIVNSKLNYESVQEKTLLSADEIKQLAKMLNYRKDRKIERGNCFDPHHAIIIMLPAMLL